jgi:hypothetical protein
MYQIAIFLLHFDLRQTLYNFFEFLSFRTKPKLEATTEITNIEEGAFINQVIER